MLEAISKVTALQYSWFISEFSLQIMWLYLWLLGAYTLEETTN
jgi:hypothetical protein